MKARYFLLPVVALLFLFGAWGSSAHQPEIIFQKKGDIQIKNPETSKAFYDDLQGSPRNYFIDFPTQGGSASGWDLYLNLLVPEPANRKGRYSADVFSLKDGEEQRIGSLESSSSEWQQFYEPFGRDYYLKGPEFDKQVSAGRYRIEVFSADNQGKYVLAIGKKEIYDINSFSNIKNIKSFIGENGISLLNIYWQLPLLKMAFFKSDVLQFFLTPFGVAGVSAIGALLIFLAVIYYLIGLFQEIKKHNQAKTLLLTSAGMQMKSEIIKLLQKPAYDITVAFISTAAKQEENLEFLKRDWNIMRDEMGFNLEEVDIEGKTEAQVMKLLELKDIIFVEGGNTFYLLKAMRKCNFERIIRKLLKWGKVYIGVSAGSIVAGQTIKTAGWKDQDKNIVKLKNLKGLNLVPFDIFVHYQPEHAEIIKQNIKNPNKRKKALRILTDDQAILVQGKEIALIGKGEQTII